ncbi:NAD-dependent epimerase/dehydratase family protein [Kribbella turkmenica]|uniref:dTDP-4-dehydrorhamnose reductase n=1 Tax=Kribbella turkmenica TaxID=2530375 RepID=A0A4R4WYD8_9ACTN|nr:sugar nucleotide-binding protein [Kribbella turkmenica]TDD22808.1 NAD-dependent epimerase/dehydratase family protein [Kribbella turkmenica]
MRVLVTGAAGLLGGEVVRLAEHEVVPTYHRQAVPGGIRMDVRDHDQVDSVIRKVRPDGIIHAAFLQSDWTTTAEGPANIALAARGIRLVFVSTDVVFGGGDEPYDEDASPCPVTPYGAAKAAAETAIRAVDPSAVIARTSLVVGYDGTSATERLVHALAAGEPGALYTGNIRCPVNVTDLASALLELLAGDIRGTAHVAGPDAVNRLELGRLIATRDGLDPQSLPFTPGLPSDVRLDSSRTQKQLRTRLRGVHEFLGG